MLRQYFLFVFLIIYFSGSFADIQQRIDDTGKDYLGHRFLNAVFIFAKDNKTLLIGSKGVFDLHGELLKANEVMPVVGASTLFTATAILTLQDKNLLDVNDKIGKYIDESLWCGNHPSWVNKISIHHLLTHSSGLAEYFGNVDIDPSMSQQEINEKILLYIASKDLEIPIGTKYKFSKTNFVVLRMIIEKIIKKDLQDFFNEEFFTPLNMKATKLESFSDALRVQRNVVSSNYPLYPLRYFVKPNNTQKPEFSPVELEYLIVPYADGGIISTPSDMLKWYQALNEGKILSEKSRELMLRKHFLVNNETDSACKTYTGYGIFLTQCNPKHLIIHTSGDAIGLRSEMGYVLPDNFYFSILSNVTVDISEVDKNNIDMSNPLNQLDIIYFRNAMIEAATEEEKEK